MLGWLMSYLVGWLHDYWVGLVRSESTTWPMGGWGLDRDF